ncbi:MULTISPECIES: pyridoxamine 5'-phosphate oxidase [Thiomicrorhabdus]|uniref:Pyridoxine/pyridoxamine 5'-phosphate oxidase n=1 Tax=Thiomicrorhabdus heinhorstiae TaxID=2748010 RepID=A0ABS0BX21_9GAMM|nr:MULTISPECIES: pyridoxamine 5'-phosphate oxidase [Thiomicrorhabdus]MBF6058315.1 pyridoxamine 5'-phosphate oxidase [Thiomicrorhabdus heinhorstiae]
MPNRDYRQSRREYLASELNEDQVQSDPYRQFGLWMDQAVEKIPYDPTAMSVSTVDANGQPHSRVVLLKSFDSEGFVFYTHYQSAKGFQIEHNSKGALLFFWPELDRQIRIEGELQKIDPQDSENYFHSRPHDSQVAAASSVQSTPVDNRQTLEARFSELEEKYRDIEVPYPQHWGGYRLQAQLFEFWQGRANRLHDRLCYYRANSAWKIQRLAP